MAVPLLALRVGLQTKAGTADLATAREIRGGSLSLSLSLSLSVASATSIRSEVGFALLEQTRGCAFCDLSAERSF
jgi:hypothetical protein